MRRLAAIVALASIASLPLAARADTDARAVFAGTWEGGGTFVKSDLGKAGTSTDHTTCRWEFETTYLVCTQRTEGVFGSGVDIAIYTRTPAGGYAFVGIDPDGTTRSPKLVANADGSLTYSSEFDANGKHVLVQTINTFPSPGVEHWWVQYSTDGGKTWTRSGDGTERKISAAP